MITRAQAEASHWAQALASAGHEVIKLPLLAFGPTPHPDRLSQAWLQAGSYHAAMFVSGQAARAFFAVRPPGMVWPARCWVTGPGTRAAVLAAGVPAEMIDTPPTDAARLDSEALWAVVAPQVASAVGGATQSVLLVRGTDAGAAPSERHQGHGRDWLAQRLMEAGVRVDYAVAYQRVAPVWSAEQLHGAQQSAIDGAVWLFSSSQAVAHLTALMPQQHWARARALATHPRIGDALLAAGWGDVSVCKGDLASVLAALGGASDINRIPA